MISLDDAVTGFLAHKRALARKYVSEEAELRLLVRFASEHGVERLEQLSPAVLDEFLASRQRSNARSFNHLLGVVGCLLDWSVAQELLECSPLQTRRRRVTATRIPFILDAAQARRLLDAAGALSDGSRAPHRGATYRTIFALCYGLGLRGGEACALRVGDIDRSRELLIVKGGKFGKSRLVPHGPRIGALIDEQLNRRIAGGRLDDQAPLFTFNRHASISRQAASGTFTQLARALGFTTPAGLSAPRLHSLRHSFAVGCLLRWYRQGLDPASRLHQLSTFMGHVDPISTAVYLTITPTLLQEANRRYEAFAEPIWTEVLR
jgi:integrase